MTVDGRTLSTGRVIRSVTADVTFWARPTECEGPAQATVAEIDEVLVLLREEMLTRLQADGTFATTILPAADRIQPGVKLLHKLTQQPLIVLELEGDGAGPWFTARALDMQTFRCRREEVEIDVRPGPSRPGGQYL